MKNKLTILILMIGFSSLSQTTIADDSSMDHSVISGHKVMQQLSYEERVLDAVPAIEYEQKTVEKLTIDKKLSFDEVSFNRFGDGSHSLKTTP